MDVVGIACRSLLRNLFPAHVVRKKLSCSPQAIVRRLKSVREAPLFMHLRRGMTVSAYFVNPYCNYAKERAREETHGSTRSNILQGVRAVKRFYDDVQSRSQHDQGELGIQGEVNIHLLRTNPYVSCARIKRTNGKEDLLYVGFLLRKRLGTDGPSLLIHGEDKVALAFEAHLVQLDADADVLFRWDRDGMDFRESYLGSGRHDVFLCHNNADKDKVRSINRLLMEEGFLPWFDEDSIRAGNFWKKEIQEGLRGVKCAVVCFGPGGVGPWQQMELYGILNRAVQEKMPIFPIILDGVKGNPMPDDFLREYQCIDFRISKEAAFKKLCSRIREVTGWEREPYRHIAY